MTTASLPAPLRMFQQFSRYPAGKTLFSRALCMKAPYFSSIKPTVSALRPGYAEVKIRKRRAVLNHIGTVHAIAMCNMAELAGGLMTDVTIPTTHRWIPKGMIVEYLKKAETDLTGIAQAEIPQEWPQAGEFPAQVEIRDEKGQAVARMTISMWVTAKK